MRDRHPPSLQPPQIMSKYIKHVKNLVYGVYTLRCYRCKDTYSVIVTVSDKGGNYLQVSRIKGRKTSSPYAAFQQAKRIIGCWAPPRPISGNFTFHSANFFEHRRQFQAERSQFEGMDWFFFNGFNSYHWPHLMVQKRYASQPSLLDILNEEEELVKKDEEDDDDLF